ncbi:hypothetical protein AAG570_013899 [Ranatra chinensis]|uniref:Uncharacterized protein n=1 Tax=Ranatra chinensis TaxID=642074 RepID=A0ABD0YQ38_9HEMI
MLGVKEDCETLIQMFVKKNSLDYRDFSEAWHTLQFQYIFRKRIKIRIEKDTWEDLKFFIAGIKHECGEVAFCFYKLLSSCAFDFVFKSEFYTMEFARKRVPTTFFREHYQEENKTARKMANSVMKDAGLDETTWTQQEDSYNSIKEQILNIESTNKSKTPDSSRGLSKKLRSMWNTGELSTDITEGGANDEDPISIQHMPSIDVNLTEQETEDDEEDD